MSKGSRQRPVQKDLFNDNFDRIFRSKEAKPDTPVFYGHKSEIDSMMGVWPRPEPSNPVITWGACLVCDEVTQHRDGECYKCELERGNGQT